MPAENCKLTIDAVIFDLDGTLIDSAPIYYRIIDITFDRLGLPPVSRATLREAMDDGEFKWDRVLPARMKSRRQELAAKARAIINDIVPGMFRGQVKIICGAVEILEAIAAGGVKIGLVTSTPAQHLAIKLTPLKKAGIGNLLEVIITADDVRNKKPAGEPLLKCAEILEVAPGRSVYVGDTRVDIRAGKAAGMQTIGVLTGFDDYPALAKEKPDAIIASVAHLAETPIFSAFAADAPNN